MKTGTATALRCCHCLWKGTDDDPVRIMWNERARQEQALCESAVKCWRRFDSTHHFSHTEET